LFDEQLPIDVVDQALSFKSECPPDKKFKVEDLFEFRRGRGDFHVSIAAALVAVFLLLFFWTETGWQNRKLPDNVGQYVGYQLGLAEFEGRKPRLGSILKQSWVAPMLCLALLVPTALWNLRSSLKVRRWRQRFMLPIDGGYEASKYFAWRLGYRTIRWLCIGLASSFSIVVIFRSLLQIKTPASIWLYDQLPAALRVFMLTYF